MEGGESSVPGPALEPPAREGNTVAPLQHWQAKGHGGRIRAPAPRASPGPPPRTRSPVRRSVCMPACMSNGTASINGRNINRFWRHSADTPSATCLRHPRTGHRQSEEVLDCHIALSKTCPPRCEITCRSMRRRSTSRRSIMPGASTATSMMARRPHIASPGRP